MTTVDPGWPPVSGPPLLAYACVFSMTLDSDLGRRPAPAQAKMSLEGGKARYITPTLVLVAVPLLLVNWFVVVAILGSTCALPFKGGNLTECGGGLSEEEMSAVSGLIALAMVVIQLGLIVRVSRRMRSQ